MAGRRPTNKEKERRYHQIAIEVKAGADPNAVAEKYGCNRKTVTRALKWFESERPPPGQYDPEQLIFEQILAYDVAMEDLGKIRMDPTASDREKMRAIEVQNYVRERRFNFLMKVGIIPAPTEDRAGIRREVLGNFVQSFRADGPEVFEAMHALAEKWLAEQE
jgi:hypothetical protein